METCLRSWGVFCVCFGAGGRERGYCGLVADLVRGHGMVSEPYTSVVFDAARLLLIFK